MATAIVLEPMHTVKCHLSLGVDLNDRCYTGYQTLLHMACQWDDIELVKLLMRLGVDTTVRDCDGMTPFMVADSHGREDILELLAGYTTQHQ